MITLLSIWHTTGGINIYIWIHKQPLFLWQIAFCFKLFGVNEFVLRLPDVILGSAFVLAAYRSCSLLINKRAGLIAGALIISNMYLIELVSGRQELDHNDFSFIVYNSPSIWAFIEYKFTGKRYWIYLIGIFSAL